MYSLIKSTLFDLSFFSQMYVYEIRQCAFSRADQTGHAWHVFYMSHSVRKSDRVNNDEVRHKPAYSATVTNKNIESVAAANILIIISSDMITKALVNLR